MVHRPVSKDLMLVHYWLSGKRGGNKCLFFVPQGKGKLTSPTVSSRLLFSVMWISFNCFISHYMTVSDCILDPSMMIVIVVGCSAFVIVVVVIIAAVVAVVIIRKRRLVVTLRLGDFWNESSFTRSFVNFTRFKKRINSFALSLLD